METTLLRSLTSIFLFFSVLLSFSQAEFTTDGVAVTFDFESYTGAGLTSGAATSGTEDSEVWAVDFDDDGVIDADFGASNTAGAYAGGTVSGTANSGADELYAGINASAGVMFGIDMTNNNGEDQPNAAIMRVLNNSGGVLTDVAISADLFYRTENSRAVTLTVSYSSDNSSWLGETTAFTSSTNNTAWSSASDATYAATISGLSITNGSYFYLKWTWEATNNANTKGSVALDDVSLTPTIVGTATDSELTLDSDGSATVASTVVSSTGQSVLGFTIEDDALGAGDSYNFTFSDLTINAGASDGVDDWSDVIAGAQLDDGTNTATASSITSGAIVFSSLGTSSGEIGYIADDGAKSYTLSVWFNTSISESIDNDYLQFSVEASGFTYSGVTSELNSSETITTSSTTNQITVTADQWGFINTPTSVGTEVDFSLTISTTDAYGNTDVDNSSASFTLAEAAGASGTLTNSAGSLTQTVSSGSFTFSNLSYDVSETFSIDLTSGTFSTINTGNIVAALSFRSAATGTWGTAANWEYFSSGVWTNASGLGSPTNNDGPIAILSGHQINVGTATTADQVTIENGGELILNAVLTVEDASGEDDLIVENGGLLTANNALPSFNGSANVLIEEGGTIATTNSNYEDDLAGSGSTNYNYATKSIFQFTETNNFDADTYFPNATSTDYPILQVSSGNALGNKTQCRLANSDS